MTPLTKREIKDIKSLASKKGRTQKNLFIVEGVRAIEEGGRHNRFPECLYCVEAGLSERERKLVAGLRLRNIRVSAIDPAQLRSISATETPSGLLGIFPKVLTSTDELLGGGYRRVLLCDGIADPGNLGTLMRSALAFGFDGLITDERTADPFASKVVRSSAGAIFGLGIGRAAAEDIMGGLSNRAGSLIVADLRGRPLPKRVGRGLAGQPLILALGAEAAGISEALLREADRIWRVPQREAVESLNVAMAGSIIMHRLFEDDKE